MRLKFLFFPIVVIISLTLFVNYIWPDIGDLRSANTDRIIKRAQLQDIQDKKQAADKVDGVINSDVDGEKIVDDYLPSIRNEESVIANVNYLASDSSVSLVDVTFAKQPDNTTDSLFIAPNDPAAAATATPQVNSLQNTEATVVISGSYDKIKLFLDGLQHLPIMNSIKSFTVSSPKDDVNANDTKQSASILSAKIVVDFNYLNVTKISGSRVQNFNPAVDREAIETLKQYVSQKSSPLATQTTDNGKSNPFIQ